MIAAEWLKFSPKSWIVNPVKERVGLSGQAILKIGEDILAIDKVALWDIPWAPTGIMSWLSNERRPFYEGPVCDYYRITETDKAEIRARNFTVPPRVLLRKSKKGYVSVMDTRHIVVATFFDKGVFEYQRMREEAKKDANSQIQSKV